MTLINVDKESAGALNPSIDADDPVINRMAHGTSSIAPRAAGTTGGRIVTKDDTITIYDTQNERIVIGRLPDGTYGIVVSAAGNDVSSVV